ncbi:heterogeneous nuclear ribonucleoprotein K [Strongylocentrotus purpuratus]|uniref:K Homology domain-containing protein n=1 Tax=Strongylocentrotus purpuratus TaxID=7668 RepID=A0A7M7RDD2_STRPU|nr:heterogeneous nuclear ribonucleoprotein K [Strongylocentrotus purpuratus]|eukprot:XP_781909.1 PREDICTED: heterogeneous nuclear ribonucleoprotein K-like [Strongylocentrotus purpuratus]
MSEDQDYGSGEGGKRSAEDQRQNQNKRPRGDYNQIIFRLMIRSINAGGVIGKGGENIKRLRVDYDAKVSIPDCNGPERIIKIGTRNVDNAIDCIKDIIPSVGEKKHSQDQQNNSFIRIMVHQSHAGAIIGRAGFKIKELREKTGAHFKVYTETCPKSTDRVVQLTGSPDVIAKAAREVYEICTETAVKGPVQDYDPFCHDLDFYNQYGGYLFDPAEEVHGGGERGGFGGERGGGHWNRGPPMGRRGRMGFDRGMSGGNDNFGGFSRSPYVGGGGGGGGGGHLGGGGGGGGGMRGDRGGRGRGRGGRDGGGIGGRPRFDRDQQFGAQGFDFGGDAGGRGQSNFGSGGGGGAGAGGFEGGPGAGAGGEASQSQQVTIPNDLAGSIIGRGGQRIKRIRMQSGAQIKIDDPLSGAKDRIITITGTQHDIAHAKFLLQNSVKEYQNSGGALQ